MNPEIKARWVQALRSGEYEQARGYLRTPEGFCCLGVLCEIAVADGVIAPPELPVFSEDDSENYYTYGETSITALPPEVVKWAGLPGTDPDAGEHTLAALNDGVMLDSFNPNAVAPHTFAQIADIIEEKL